MEIIGPIDLRKIVLLVLLVLMLLVLVAGLGLRRKDRIIQKEHEQGHEPTYEERQIFNVEVMSEYNCKHV